MNKSLPYLTRYLFKYIDSYIDESIKVEGIDNLSCGIIDFLRNQEVDELKTIQKDVEKEFLLPKAVASERISSLETNGYLIKEKDPLDSRKYNLVLTNKGREIADSFYDQLVEYHEKILSCLTSKEEDNFVNALTKVVENLKEEEKNGKK